MKGPDGQFGVDEVLDGRDAQSPAEMYRSSEDVETSQTSYVKHVLYYVKDMAKQQASRTLCFPHSMLSRVVLHAGVLACGRIPGVSSTSAQ